MIGVTTESDGALQRVRIVGSLSYGELSTLIERFSQGPGQAACLLDLSGAKATELRFPEVRALARLSHRTGFPRPGMRIGVVAPNPVTFGVCRMLEGMRDDLQDGFRVFSSEAEAAAWVRTPHLA